MAEKESFKVERVTRSGENHREGSRHDMGLAEEDRLEQRPLEKCCCGLMFPKEIKDIMNEFRKVIRLHVALAGCSLPITRLEEK